MKKKCTKCDTDKLLKEFFKDKSFKDGHSSICKACKNKKTQQWRIDNRKKYNEIAKKHNKKYYDKLHSDEV